MKAVISNSADVRACIAHLQAQVSSPPTLVVFFASSRHDGAELALQFQDAFPVTTVIGCSTAGEISSGAMSEGTVSAMAIPSGIAKRVAAVPLENLRAGGSVHNALEAIASRLGERLQSLDPTTHAGLVLVDGLSGAEERLMETLGDLTDLPFIGGAAGDDLAFKKTYVSIDGRIYGDAAVLAVLELPNGYEIVKTQSFRSRGKALTATRVNEAARSVLEFNGERADLAYARALGIAVCDLPNHFTRHPLGLMVGDEPFVRSPQRITPDGAIVFYCNIREGMELEILESTDIVSDTGLAVESHCAKLRAAGGLIDFDCILRALELRAGGKCQEYGRLFETIPTIGFSTYGEEYLGHINQTATMLMLAAPAQ